MKSREFGSILSGAAALLLGPVLVAPAAAQDVQEEEEIVVTARFRAESAQDVGASVTALSGDALDREGVTDFEDLARRTGLTTIDRGPSQNDVALRGVANGVAPRLSDLGGAGPLVSQFLDDLPVAAATASQRDFNYFDFDRVEILRGPQPTLFGEGSVGGTIRYFSRDPDLGAEGFSDSILRTSVSFTEDGGTNYSVSVATSAVLIPDRLGVRAVLNYRNDDGFIDNPTLGVEDANDYQAVSGRLVVLYEPTPDLTVRFVAFSGRDEFGGTNEVDAPPAPMDRFTLSTPVNGNNEDNFDLYSVRIEYDFGAITATSITGLYERDRHDQFFDAQSAAGFGLFTTALTAVGQSQTEDSSFTQEFRFVSDFDGPLNFTAGLYYQDAEFTSMLTTTAAEFAPYTTPVGGTTLIEQAGVTESTQISGFAELTYAASERLRLIAGARYVDEEITSTSLASLAAFGGGPTGLSPPFVITDVNALAGLFGLPLTETFELNTWLPRVAIEYDLSDDAMLYAIVSTGVRNGNMNPFTSALRGAGTPPNPALFAAARSFDEDEVLSYELGVKTQWLDGDLALNAAIFQTSYDNPQILTSNPFVLTLNGPDIEIVGIEAQSTWRANDEWSFYANGTWQDAEFTDGAVLGNPLVLAGLGFTEDLREGNRPVNTPEWQFALGADFRQPIGGGFDLIGNASYQFIGSRYSMAQNYPSSELGSQEFVNLRLGIENFNWTLVGFVANATNEIEYQAIQGNAGTPILNAGQLDFRPTSVAINRPRTIGVEFSLRF